MTAPGPSSDAYDMSVTGSVQPAGAAPVNSRDKADDYCGLGSPRDSRRNGRVLEGPDGIRMAIRGDVVPGIGRIDSIVRWGNRWIVAAASGLISTP